MGSSTHSYDSLRLPSGATRRAPIAANTLIHPGVLCGINITGYAVAYDTDCVSVLGWSEDLYDNRTGSAAGGTNGDIYGEFSVGVGTMHGKSGDDFGITDIGVPVYASTTASAAWYEVQKTAGASPQVGWLFGFEAEGGLPLIDIREPAALAFIAAPDVVTKATTATLTAAEITNTGRGGAFIVSSTAAAVTLTTPTAAEILAALPGLPIGGAVPLTVQNTGGTNAITITGGTSVTPSTGNATVALNSTNSYLIRRSGAVTVELRRVG